MRVFIRATEFLADDDDVADDAHWFFELGPLRNDDRDDAALRNDDGDDAISRNDDGDDAVSHDDGYRTYEYDGDDAVSRDDGYSARDENDDDLPSHALDMYDQTFGDGCNGSSNSDNHDVGGDSMDRCDDYVVDRGDSLTGYDDTFYTATDQPSTPHPTPRSHFTRFKELENRRAKNLNEAIPYPEVIERRPSAIASRALTRQVFDTEETDPADGYYMGQAAISGPKTFREAMASPQSAK
ncbi:hypothetical protein LPJ62_005975 [Coemansia sp. RSA 2167]|nr:hypothetical protein LPJ62_005975 [Coemansia sp. RSA 2167]